MRGKSWNTVAKEQFDSMPKDFRDDWSDLRKIVHGNK